MADKSAEESQHTAGTRQCDYMMRPIEMSDADTVAHWFQQIEDVSIFDRQIPIPINHADVVELFRSLLSEPKRKSCRWFITEDQDGSAVGMTGLEQINALHGNAVLPLFVATPWRRTGVGIRMASMMIDLAFKQLRLHRVATLYRADNAASDALLGRLGFTIEGTARQSWFNNGQHYDLHNAGILCNEWNQTRPLLSKMLSKDVTVTLGPNPASSWCWPSKTVSKQ